MSRPTKVLTPLHVHIRFHGRLLGERKSASLALLASNQKCPSNEGNSNQRSSISR